MYEAVAAVIDPHQRGPSHPYPRPPRLPHGVVTLTMPAPRCAADRARRAALQACCHDKSTYWSYLPSELFTHYLFGYLHPICHYQAVLPDHLADFPAVAAPDGGLLLCRHGGDDVYQLQLTRPALKACLSVDPRPRGDDEDYQPIVTAVVHNQLRSAYFSADDNTLITTDERGELMLQLTLPDPSVLLADSATAATGPWVLGESAVPFVAATGVIYYLVRQIKSVPRTWAYGVISLTDIWQPNPHRVVVRSWLLPVRMGGTIIDSEVPRVAIRGYSSAHEAVVIEVEETWPAPESDINATYCRYLAWVKQTGVVVKRLDCQPKRPLLASLVYERRDDHGVITERVACVYGTAQRFRVHLHQWDGISDYGYSVCLWNTPSYPPIFTFTTNGLLVCTYRDRLDRVMWWR